MHARRRVDALLRKAVQAADDNQGAVGRVSSAAGGYRWREELEEIHEHTAGVGHSLWKRARALQPRPCISTTDTQHGGAAVSRTSADWVNAVAWQATLDMYVFMFESSDDGFRQHAQRTMLTMLRPMPPCAFIGPLDASQRDAVDAFGRLLLRLVEAACDDGARITPDCLPLVIEFAVVRGSLRFSLMLVMLLLTRCPLSAACGRQFQRAGACVEREESDGSDWETHLHQVARRCTHPDLDPHSHVDQHVCSALLTMLAPLQALATRISELQKKPMVAACIEASLDTVGLLSDLLGMTANTPERSALWNQAPQHFDSEERAVAMCAIMHLLQLNLERLPATELARVMEPQHAATRTGLLSMLNQLSHGAEGVTAWGVELRRSVQVAAQECIAAGISFFFHTQADKMAAIVSRLSQAMPGISSEHMATHLPLQPVDMIAGLLLNDISRPEMLLDLLNLRAASNLKAGEEEPVNADVHGHPSKLPELLQILELLGQQEQQRLKWELRQVGEPVGSTQLRPSVSDSCGVLEAVLNCSKMEEEWTWDNFHTPSMELSQDKLSIKKTSDSPDFSSAMGSVAFSSGYHTWEIKMNTVTRVWVGVASAEHFDLGQHPTGFRDVWLISSFGAQHPDANSQSFGSTLSLETMFTSGDVIGVHLDMDEGVLCFVKNGTPCKNAKFTDLQGKTLCPVVCMDNAGDCAVLMSRQKMMYQVGRKVISGRTAFHSLLMQVVSMMVSTQETAVQAQMVGFCTRVLHLGMCFVRDVLDLCVKAQAAHGASRVAVTAALDQSMICEMLPCLESLTLALLAGMDQGNKSSGTSGLGEAAHDTEVMMSVETLHRLEELYQRTCELVQNHPTMQSTRQDELSTSATALQRGKAKMGAEKGESQWFVACLQETTGRPQTIRVMLPLSNATAEAGQDTTATHASANARTFSVTCEDAAYMLIEFDAVLDARAALVVTSANGSIVAQFTGPSYCWPQRQMFVAGCTCELQVRGANAHAGRLLATVTGYQAPAASATTSGWEVHQGYRVLTLAQVHGARLPLVPHELTQRAANALSAAPLELSADCLRAIELAAKTVLYKMLVELVRERDEWATEHTQSKALAAEVVTPEDVERIIRRVLPQSLHRSALEECLKCQREHQLLLHSNTADAAHEAAYPHQASSSSSSAAASSGASGSMGAVGLGPSLFSARRASTGGSEEAEPRMGLMAAPHDDAASQQVVTVQSVADWFHTVACGLTLQSEVFIYFKAIAQHVAQAVVCAGAKATGDLQLGAPPLLEPTHIQLGLQDTPLGELLAPLSFVDDTGSPATLPVEALMARWRPPRRPLHWLPRHRQLLAGLTGCVAACLLRAPALSSRTGAVPNPCAALLTSPPFTSGIRRDTTAATAMLTACLGDRAGSPSSSGSSSSTTDGCKKEVAPVPAGLDTEQAAWSLRLEEWAAAAAGPAAAAELRAALHAFAVTVALLSGAVTLLPSRQPKLCKTVERVLTQHLSTIKMELMGLKVTQQVSYAALHATVHATCAALLRFAPTLQEMSLSLARGSAASTTTTTTTTTTVAAAAAADGSGGDGGDYSDNGHVGVADGVAQGIGALDSPVAIHESLATLCGWLRQVVHSNLAPQLLGMADSAQERAAAALGALTAMLRMIEWAPPHAQTAVEALLEGWPAAVSYTGLAAGASAVSKRSLRTAAQAVLAAAVRALAGQADGSARSQGMEATLVQLLLRRLDARDVTFLVDGTPLLAMLEQQLAIAGARIDAGGVVGQRMWRLLSTLVLHVGAEGAQLAPHTITRVLACVRSVLGCALGQMFLGATHAAARLTRSASVPGKDDGAGSVAREHEGAACLRLLEVSSGHSDTLLDLSNDLAWMPQDSAPTVTLHMQPELALRNVWLWIPSDRDGSRQSMQIEVLGGASAATATLLHTRTFVSMEEARSAFQPSTIPGVSGDLCLVADALQTPALAGAAVVVVRFKQPLLHNRLFNLSLTEEHMYRLKIYGMRITAHATTQLPRFGTVAQLGSLVDVSSNLLQVVCMVPPVRASLNAEAAQWLPLWLRALRNSHVLGGTAGGYLPTYHLRLKVVQLLPFVLCGTMSESTLYTAYNSLLDIVTLCSPEVLMLPDVDNAGRTYDDDSLGKSSEAQATAAPTLKLRQALIGMLRRQLMGDTASPAAVRALQHRLTAVCVEVPSSSKGGSGTDQGACSGACDDKAAAGDKQPLGLDAAAVRAALPAVLVLGGFTDGMMASRTMPGSSLSMVPHATPATAAHCPSLACTLPPVANPDGKRDESVEGSVCSSAAKMDSGLLRTFLDLCECLCLQDTVATARAASARSSVDQPSLAASSASSSAPRLAALAAPDARRTSAVEQCAHAQRLLCTRSLKALWELLSLPGVRCEMHKRPALLTALYAQSTQRTTVPLDSSIQSLAARSIALCTLTSTGVATAATDGVQSAAASAEQMADSPRLGRRASDHGDATSDMADAMASASRSQAPPMMTLQAEERALEQAAMDLDTSLLLQATPDHEVMIATNDVNAAAGGADRPPPSWLEQAVAAVPLQHTSPETIAADLATTEEALKVYYARLVFLKLLQSTSPARLPAVAPLTLPVLLQTIRPLFLCPVDAVHRQLQPVCPRPLVQAPESGTSTVVAADAAFAAWAQGDGNVDGVDGKAERLAALTGPFLHELEALRPPKGAGQNDCMHSVVIESAHEYKNRTLFARKLTIPEACSLQVTFDEKCSTEKKCDYLAFYAHEEDWRNSKPSIRMCDGPPGSSGWKPLMVKGSALVYAFHSDKRNTDWGYRFTVQGLNKRGEPRLTRSFILEGVHPGKERSFSGAETLHVKLGTFGQSSPPALQLQFHPTCTVEKPDQQLIIADTLYSGAVGSSTWPASTHVPGGSFECAFTCTKQKSCVFKWRVAVQPTAAVGLSARSQLSEVTASPALVTAAPFVHWLLRNIVTHFSPATSVAHSAVVESTHHRPAAAEAIETGGAAFFHAATVKLGTLVIDPELKPAMRTLLLRSLTHLLTADDRARGAWMGSARTTLLNTGTALSMSRALWSAAAVQYAVEHRSIGTHTCFASPLLSSLCEAAYAVMRESGVAGLDMTAHLLPHGATSRQETPRAFPPPPGPVPGLLLRDPALLHRRSGGNVSRSSTSPNRADSGRTLPMPGSITEAVEEVRSQSLSSRQFLYSRLWEMMQSMSREVPLPRWLRDEVLRSLSKSDSMVWALPMFERCGDGCTMSAHSVTFTRRCTVLCNRPMYRSTGIYTCDFKIDEGRQILVGVALRDSFTETYLGDDSMKLAWGYMNSGRVRSLAAWTSHRLDTFDEGDIITVKLDTNRGRLSFAKNDALVGIVDNVTQWPMVFAAGGSRMGATTITNATHDSEPSKSGDSGGATGAARAGAAVGQAYEDGLAAYLSSPLSAMDNTDGWGLQADSQLVMFAAERAAERKVTLMQLNPDHLLGNDEQDDAARQLLQRTSSCVAFPTTAGGEAWMAGDIHSSGVHTHPLSSPRLRTAAREHRPESAAEGSSRHRVMQTSQGVQFTMLGDRPPEALKARFAVLQLYNNLCRLCLPLLAGSWLGSQLHATKGRLFPETKAQCHDLALSLTTLPGTVPSVSINRARAAAGRSKKHTVFYQLFGTLEGHSMRTAHHTSMLWHVSFEGEGGIDQGGLFRESLTEMSKELHGPLLGLFVECPNNRRATGSNMDKWLPNSSKKAQHELTLFRFLGTVMGGMIRTKNVLALDLPPVFWKQVLQEPTSITDLFQIDEVQARMLERVRSVHDEDAWARIVGTGGLLWAAEDMHGSMYPLRVEGGEVTRVSFDERDQYYREVLAMRLSECNPQMAAIRQGLLQTIPPLVLSLMTWRELEMAVCGKPEINIETLKSMTAMNLGNHEKLRQWFWAVLEGFKNEERADFLAFACGRSRLPTRPTGTMLWVNLDTSKGDAHCPTSHTCTLTIDLPAYSSKEVLQERLLYAIHNCREIDTDFAARDFGNSGELLMELYTRDGEEEDDDDEEYDEGSSEMQSFGITMSNLGHEMERHSVEPHVGLLATDRENNADEDSWEGSDYESDEEADSRNS